MSPSVRPVELVVYPSEVEPENPVIESVELDLHNRWLGTQVTEHPDFPVVSVDAYHDVFPGGKVELSPALNWWEDPYGWYCDLPCELTSYNQSEVVVVAVVTVGPCHGQAVGAVREPFPGIKVML